MKLKHVRSTYSKRDWIFRGDIYLSNMSRLNTPLCCTYRYRYRYSQIKLRHAPTMRRQNWIRYTVQYGMVLYCNTKLRQSIKITIPYLFFFLISFRNPIIAISIWKNMFATVQVSSVPHYVYYVRMIGVGVTGAILE